MRVWLVACLSVPLLANAESGPPPAVMTAMLQLYGRYDPPGRCWQTPAHADNSTVPACLAIVHADEVAAPEGKRTYVVLEGRGDRDCHGCARTIAFIVFGGADGLRVLAHSPATPDGGDGLPTDPGQVTLHQLGASQWGWVEQTSNSRQDDGNSNYVVWLPRAERVVQVAQFPAARDNKGAGECASGARSEDCYDITVSYRIDAQNPGAPYYPILLQATGRKQHHRVTGQAVARFDLAKYAYRVSPGLP